MRTNNAHTDSITTDYHEDGSWTTTSVVTERPATTAEQAKAWGVLGALGVISFAPLICVVAAEKLDARRARKAAKKAEQKKD